MLPEEAAHCADLRQKVLANKAQGLPLHTGIDENELKKAVEITRADYRAAQGKSKAAGVTNPGGGPPPDLDLTTLFGPKK